MFYQKQRKIFDLVSQNFLNFQHEDYYWILSDEQECVHEKTCQIISIKLSM